MSPIQQTGNTTDVKQTVANGASSSKPRELKNMSAGKKSVKTGDSESEGKVYIRDGLTGRLLADDGESCLRCIDKGLKCTLIFLGFENEAKCAACRRSKSQYCIRQRRPQDCYMFYGHPWNSPNYFAVGQGPNSREMEEILKEHFVGKIIDSPGGYSYIYIYGQRRNSITLPAFNGSDLPAAIRPKDFESKTWEDVLPIPMNKSALCRLKDKEEKGKAAEERAEKMRNAMVALNTPVTALGTPGFGTPARKGNFQQRSRYYPIRGMHLREYIANMEEVPGAQITEIEQKNRRRSVGP